MLGSVITPDVGGQTATFPRICSRPGRYPVSPRSDTLVKERADLDDLQTWKGGSNFALSLTSIGTQKALRFAKRPSNGPSQPDEHL